MQRKNVLVAFGERNPQLRQQIEDVFSKGEYNILNSSANKSLDIQATVDGINKEYGDIDVFIYVPHPIYRASILDDNIDDKFYRSIHEDLEAGTWWIQAVSKSMVSQENRGRIIILTHINSLVPSQQFSYSSAGQAALMNLGRVAALELSEYGICTNFVVMGWSENGNEKEFVDILRETHREDKIPLLPYIPEQEVAKICFHLSDPEITTINGATITVDGGYSITRFIRELDK